MARQSTRQPETDRNGQGDQDDGSGVTVRYISRREGSALLDRQARKYLGMSGEEFKRRYREGTIEDPERADVLRISFLIPMSEE